MSEWIGGGPQVMEPGGYPQKKDTSTGMYPPVRPPATPRPGLMMMIEQLDVVLGIVSEQLSTLIATLDPFLAPEMAQEPSSQINPPAPEIPQATIVSVVEGLRDRAAALARRIEQVTERVDA